MSERNRSAIVQHGARYRCVAVATAVVIAVAICPARASAGGAGSGSPATEGAVDVPSDAASGVLRVEVAAELDDAEILASWIEERNAGVAETIPHVEGHEQWIAVAVSGATYDYRVWVVAMRDGVPVDVVEEAVACECNTETLLEMVGERVAEQAEALRGAAGAEATVSRTTAIEPTIGVTQDFGKRRSKTDRTLRLQAMGYAGVGAGVLGVGLLTVGATLTWRLEELWGAPGEIYTRPWRPGIGMAVGGGMVFAAGVSLLVVDLVRQRSSEVAVVPVLDPRQLGVAITWRAQGRVRR